MKLKEMVSMDVLKEFDFRLAEHNSLSGFQRYTKHYGVFLVTVCNNQLEKAIHITLNPDARKPLEGNRIVASIHQINHDLCRMASRGYIELPQPSAEPMENDWEMQMTASNPFAFMID